MAAPPQIETSGTSKTKAVITGRFVVLRVHLGFRVWGLSPFLGRCVGVPACACV